MNFRLIKSKNEISENFWQQLQEFDVNFTCKTD